MDLEGKLSATCVLYDKTTGEIVHTHQILNLPEAEPPSEGELEAEARKLAAGATGRDASVFGALSIDPDELVIGTDYAVDLEAQSLVAKQKEDRQGA